MKPPQYYPPNNEPPYDNEILYNLSAEQVAFLRYIDINPGCTYKIACRANGYTATDIDAWRKADPIFDKWVGIFMDASTSLAYDLHYTYLLNRALRGETRYIIAFLKFTGWGEQDRC